MFCVNPVIELVNDPVPVPFDVLVDNETVGLVDVDQTTPLAVTVNPPAFVIFPPLIAVVVEIEDTDVVVSVVVLASSPIITDVSSP